MTVEFYEVCSFFFLKCVLRMRTETRRVWSVFYEVCSFSSDHRTVFTVFPRGIMNWKAVL